MIHDSASSPHVDDLARAGLGGTLEPGPRPALLVIDPVRAYTDSQSPMYAAVEDEVRRMREVVAAARRSGIPIVFTRVIHETVGDGGVLARKIPGTRCFVEGHLWSQPIEGLEHDPDRDVLLTKEYPSAFFGTALAAILRRWRVDTTVIVGLSTSGCVRATALDALQREFVPIVVREAVGDRNDEVHESNLRDIAAKIGEVVALDGVLTYFGQRAESEV